VLIPQETPYSSPPPPEILVSNFNQYTKLMMLNCDTGKWPNLELCLYYTGICTYINSYNRAVFQITGTYKNFECYIDTGGEFHAMKGQVTWRQIGA
jgi:hypothetical protein